MARSRSFWFRAAFRLICVQLPVGVNSLLHFAVRHAQNASQSIFKLRVFFGLPHEGHDTAMTEPFDGIFEKLNRANQNILNLQSEIDTFIQTSKYPVIPQVDKEMALEAIAYHRQRVIPLRFSVLAGEIIHHLRSCLDHIAWHFSTPEYRRDKFRKIEFPIFKERPVKSDDIARYEGKVKGITRSDIRALIDHLQPYKSTDPEDYVLWVINDMDIIDKHRELILCSSFPAVQTRISVELQLDLIKRHLSHKRGEPNSPPVDFMDEVKRNTQIVPRIAFKQLGRREDAPLAEGLMYLTDCTREVVEGFAAELP